MTTLDVALVYGTALLISEASFRDHLTMRGRVIIPAGLATFAILLVGLLNALRGLVAP